MAAATGATIGVLARDGPVESALRLVKAMASPPSCDSDSADECLVDNTIRAFGLMLVAGLVMLAIEVVAVVAGTYLVIAGGARILRPQRPAPDQDDRGEQRRRRRGLAELLVGAAFAVSGGWGLAVFALSAAGYR